MSGSSAATLGGKSDVLGTADAEVAHLDRRQGRLGDKIHRDHYVASGARIGSPAVGCDDKGERLAGQENWSQRSLGGEVDREHVITCARIGRFAVRGDG